MRRAAFLFLLLFTVFLAPAQAQDTRTVDFDMNQPPDGFGLGIVLGDPTGLSFVYRRGEKDAFQGHLGWSLLYSRIHVSADYLYNLVILETPEMAGVTFPLYVGVGGRYRSYGGLAYPDPGLGVRIPVGMAITPRTVALDVFMEIVPLVLIVPRVEPGIEGGVGIRVYL